ncbi:M48 family peptidase [Treponema rectale]|uniref:M48 family peptidase n=1 Tax=Treponema rectale TaxID=744512 RepID=A0A840S8R2_9SPIR|nr:M48 family metallopeptidase [Treponema rectale]MBB5219049.1 STE24 endopeptidase [Treponema rectale]QOS41042.1 M48 family peptidase [Treponema rectale]
MENLFLYIFFTGAVLKFVTVHFLEYVDYKKRKLHGTEIPSELEGHVDEAVLTKTCSYENAKYFFFIPRSIVFFLLKIFLVCIYFYQDVFATVWNVTQNAYLTIILFEILVSLPGDVLSIPFDLYGEFRIEKKYGFSNMNLRMWIFDGIKSIILGLIMNAILMGAVAFILIHLNQWWWLFVSSVMIIFSLGLSFIYPIFLAPLFNKFTPIEDEELKNRLEALLEKTGFKSSGIYKMDASKRSRHSNAYFTGIGKSKRIVLYDTLIEQLTVDEIEAVLGHELGHYKKHHIIKKMLVSVPFIFAVTFLVSLILKYPPLYTSFGFAPELFKVEGLQSMHPVAALEYAGIFLLGLSLSGFGIFTGLIQNFFSRKDEFEADRFSAEVCNGGEALCTALIKLNKENLSEFVPPDIYCAFYYSHPPLLKRIRAIRQAGSYSETSSSALSK